MKIGKYSFGLKSKLKSAALALSLTIVGVGINNLAPFLPGYNLMSSSKVNVFTNIDQTTLIKDQTQVKNGDTFNRQYHAVVISARAGHQTSQAQSDVQVGHTTLLLQESWLEAKWEMLPSGSFLSFVKRETFTTFSTKGGWGITFWSVDNDLPLLEKYLEARKLGLLKYKGTSFLISQISKEVYLHYLPKQKGGKEKSLSPLGCFLYNLQPPENNNLFGCNCSTAVGSLAGDIGMPKLPHTNPTAMSAYIDFLNGDKQWYNGQLLPIKFKDK
jgi:hypothetical protein